MPSHLRGSLVLALLVLPHPCRAQTTGRIAGRALDSASQPAPATRVTVASPSLQGVRTALTDAKGEFLFAFLPPGTYDAKAELPGFRPASLGPIRVELDRTATVTLRLQMADLQETVEVKATPPEIDVTNTTTGINATADLYDRIPIARSFFAVARVAPGTQEDETGTAFYGSTGLENTYIVDGLNVTGTWFGDKAKELNFDFIEAVEVKTGGLPAEYGRTTGGILNVITKSGGNDFHGSAFGFFAGGALQSDNQTATQRPADTTTVDDTSSAYDFGAELGGRIVRDRLWFFAAFNRVIDNSQTTVIRDLESQGAPGVGSVVPGRSQANRFASKLTWRPAASSTLALSAFGDPSTFTGPVAGINGPPSTYEGSYDTGGTSLTARYEGTFGGSLLVRGSFGQYRNSFTFSGPGTAVARFDDNSVSPQASTGGIGFYGDDRTRRDVGKLDVSKFVSAHELKIGGDVEAVTGVANDYVSGGDFVARFEEDGQDFYGHYLYLDDRAPGFDPNDPATWQPILPFHSVPHTRNLSAYAQDAWRIRRNLTLNLGLRFERQKLQDRDGKTPLALDNWAPRLGAAWDVTGNGRSKLYAAWSRYFESIPQIIQYLAFGGRTFMGAYNFDPTPGAIVPDPAAPWASGAFGGGSTAVAPGIQGQSVDEWLVGFEREVRGDFVVGAKVNRRRLHRVIEDVTAGNGDYLFANPGEGVARTLAAIDGSSVPSPKARRDNLSLEATARKRFSRGWQLLASYLFTHLEGNYDGSYQRSTGQWTPNWNSGFDFANFLVNAFGPLTSESVHQLKLDGSYELRGKAKGLNLGLSTRWYSGLPLNAYGFSALYYSNQHYLVPRGTVGRNPANAEIDVHASYPIRLGKGARLLVQADAFNLLNRQAILQFDQRYNRIQDGPCAGVPDGLCSADGGILTHPGTLEPVGSLGNPRLTATNPDYLRQGRDFTGQRSLRLGLRLSF